MATRGKKIAPRRASHGGRRQGAGRKPVLTYFQEIAVGAYCENLWNGLAKREAHAQHDSFLSDAGVLYEQKRLREIPVSLRKTKSARVPGSELTVGEVLAEVSQEINIALPEGRYISIPLKRPRGRRAGIIKQAIVWCKRNYGVSITVRRAEDYWKKYRAFLKSES